MNKLIHEISDESLLEELVKQKRKYEHFFHSLPEDKVDNAAMNAYNGILKKIIELREELGGFKVESFSRFFTDFIVYLKKADPEAAKAVKRNFEGYMSHIRKKYVKNSTESKF